jgi:hypothetical protein
VSASRHVQDLDPVALPLTGGHALPAEPAPWREPTFDELVHGYGNQPPASDAGRSRRAGRGWLRPRPKPARARASHPSRTAGAARGGAAR